MGDVGRVLAAVMLIGCASGPGDSTSLVALLEREAPPRAMNSIEHPTGLFRAEVPGRLLEALEDSDNSAFGRFDIGANHPVACHFFFDRVDLASTLVQSSELIIGQIATEAGVEVRRAVEGIDAGAIAGSPFLSLDWLLWMDAGGGEIKQRAADRSGRSVYCAHDSPGYTKSFERFFAALVSTLEFPGDTRPEPFYREISVSSFHEHRVGVTEIAFVRDEAGEVRAEKFSAALIASKSDSIAANDVYQVEWSRPNGDLINAHYAAMDDDAVTELRLVATRGREWSVEGNDRSRPLEARFTSDGPLASSLSEFLVYRALAAGEEAFSIERWVPEAAPTSATRFAFERTGNAGTEGIPVRAQMGPLGVDLLLEEDGRLRRATMRVGQAELNVELVHSEGGF